MVSKRVEQGDGDGESDDTLQDRSREENWALVSRLLGSERKARKVGEVLGGFFSQAPNVLEGKAPHTHTGCLAHLSQSHEFGPAGPGIPGPTAGLQTTPFARRHPTALPSPHPTAVPFLPAAAALHSEGTDVAVF